MTERRPRRRMPSMKKVAKHRGVSVGTCYRCRRTDLPTERAHIIDRAADGLDGVQNLMPLCGPCHAEQPLFEPGDEFMALSWFELAHDGDEIVRWGDLTKVAEFARLCGVTTHQDVQAAYAARRARLTDLLAR